MIIKKRQKWSGSQPPHFFNIGRPPFVVSLAPVPHCASSPFCSLPSHHCRSPALFTWTPLIFSPLYFLSSISLSLSYLSSIFDPSRRLWAHIVLINQRQPSPLSSSVSSSESVPLPNPTRNLTSESPEKILVLSQTRKGHPSPRKRGKDRKLREKRDPKKQPLPNCCFSWVHVYLDFRECFTEDLCSCPSKASLSSIPAWISSAWDAMAGSNEVNVNESKVNWLIPPFLINQAPTTTWSNYSKFVFMNISGKFGRDTMSTRLWVSQF